MNIERKNIDEVSAVITLHVTKADYAEKVATAMKSVRKNAAIPGFRPGKAPAAMIDKMYLKSVTYDEVNKLIPEELDNYIKKEDIKLLCQPLPSENQPAIDFEKAEDFTVSFDVALRPEINYTIDKNTKLTQYEIEVSDEMINDTIKQYTARYGEYSEGETAEENDIIKANVKELEGGKVKEGGISAEGASFSPKYLKDETEKKKTVGAKKGAKITLDIKKAMQADAEIASFLKIKKEDVANIANEFEVEIVSITHYTEAKLDQALFDKALGEGVVKSEAEFKSKISEELKCSLVVDSDFKLMVDAREAAIKQLDGIKFPDAFFKRSILASNEGLTEEKLNETYEKELQEFKWTMAKDQLLIANEVKINNDDIMNFAKKVARSQFAQYGMIAVPDDVLENYAKSIIGNKEQANRLFDQIKDEKFVALLKEKANLTKKSISLKDFNAMFETAEK